MKNVTRDIKSNKGRRNPFGPGGLEMEMKLETRGGPRWAGEKERFILEQLEPAAGKNLLFLSWEKKCH